MQLFKSLWLGLLLIINITVGYGQTDSLTPKVSAKKLIIPALLITGGEISYHQVKFFSNNNIQQEVQKNLGRYRSSVDNYLQYLPNGLYIGGAVSGLKGRYGQSDQIKIGLLANGIMALSIFSLKHIIGETRPDFSDNFSMPSGHTAQAFTGATLLFEQYRYTHPVLAYSGIPIATATGTFRLINNKHWISDILIGAAVGILSTEVTYWAYPWLKRKFSKHSINY